MLYSNRDYIFTHMTGRWSRSSAISQSGSTSVEKSGWIWSVCRRFWWRLNGQTQWSLATPGNRL